MNSIDSVLNLQKFMMFGCILTCCPQGGKNRTWQPRSIWQQGRLCLGCPALFASQEQGTPGVQQPQPQLQVPSQTVWLLLYWPKITLFLPFAACSIELVVSFGTEGYFAMRFCVSVFSLPVSTDFQINLLFCCKKDRVLEETGGHKTQKWTTELFWFGNFIL